MTRQFLLSAAILFALICTATPVVSAAPTITNIGVLTGDAYSAGNAISADGSTVTGYAGYYVDHLQTNNDTAVRWTAAGGLQDLGNLPVGNTRALGFAVNADGSAIAGSSLSNNGAVNARAFRWTQSGGLASLGLLPGGTFSDARGINADGSVVVGFAGDSADHNRAFRWTNSGGMASLGVLPGMTDSWGMGVSSDGSVVVGSSFDNSTGRAFRWTSAAGMVDLGLLPGADSAGANAISGDGSVIIGDSYSSITGQTTFRWTSAGGMQDLGLGSDFEAGAINRDGSEIVGDVFSSAFTQPHAVLWTSALGVIDLNTYLPSIGVDLTGWQLQFARGISANGDTITGEGTFNGEGRGWVVTGLSVPEPFALLIAALGGVVLMAVPRRTLVARKRISIPSSRGTV
jgi:probable HAF family extracellular repeat protein